MHSLGVMGLLVSLSPYLGAPGKQVEGGWRALYVLKRPRPARAQPAWPCKKGRLLSARSSPWESDPQDTGWPGSTKEKEMPFQAYQIGYLLIIRWQ